MIIISKTDFSYFFFFLHTTYLNTKKSFILSAPKQWWVGRRRLHKIFIIPNVYFICNALIIFFLLLKAYRFVNKVFAVNRRWFEFRIDRLFSSNLVLIFLDNYYLFNFNTELIQKPPKYLTPLKTIFIIPI